MSSTRNNKERKGKARYLKKGLPSYITSSELEKGWRQRQAFLRYQRYLKKLLAAIYKED